MELIISKDTTLRTISLENKIKKSQNLVGIRMKVCRSGKPYVLTHSMTPLSALSRPHPHPWDTYLAEAHLVNLRTIRIDKDSVCLRVSQSNVFSHWKTIRKSVVYWDRTWQWILSLMKQTMRYTPRTKINRRTRGCRWVYKNEEKTQDFSIDIINNVLISFTL